MCVLLSDTNLFQSYSFFRLFGTLSFPFAAFAAIFIVSSGHPMFAVPFKYFKHYHFLVSVLVY